MTTGERWWAKGLLFENCNCQLLCPAHLGFKQLCTRERCIGHWAIHVETGRFGEVSLDGLNVVIVTDAPQLMITGGWTQVLYLDARADAPQRQAMERIFTGQVGTGWAVLAEFVATRLPTRVVPIRYEDGGRHKAMWVGDYLETRVEAIRGADRAIEARLDNVFNQIHAPAQVLALGATRYADHGLSLSTVGSHALYSRFSWSRP